jgi:glyoxylase-like metal-dependent hydrolase (beta-lactamase superfamily II)
MTDIIPYPLPPKGQDREIHACLQEGVLPPKIADGFLRRGFPWHKIAPHVQDRGWWQRQTPAQAPELHDPWSIQIFDATVKLQCYDSRIWVDPGPAAPLPDKPPDVILVTHAHYDHMAQLGAFGEAFPDCPFVMTPSTANLLKLRGPLNDDLKRQLDTNTILLEPGQTRILRGIKLRALPAGHLLGAAAFEINSDEDSILITGDFAFREVGGVPPSTWPTGAYALLLMTTSGAGWGSLPFADPEFNRYPFLSKVAGQIDAGNQRIFLPAQSMGQAQEMYTALAMAQRAGAFPDWHIRLSGFAAKVSTKYRQALEHQEGPWCDPFYTAEAAVPPKSVVITSEQGADPTSGSPLWHSTIAHDGSVTIHDASVYTHAGWSECMTFALGISCGGIGLYHGDALSLNLALSQSGRRVISLPYGELNE